MLFLIAALLLYGILIGAAAHLPGALTLTAAAAIGGWLLIFALRERRGPPRAHTHRYRREP